MPENTTAKTLQLETRTVCRLGRAIATIVEREKINDPIYHWMVFEPPRFPLTVKPGDDNDDGYAGRLAHCCYRKNTHAVLGAVVLAALKLLPTLALRYEGSYILTPVCIEHEQLMIWSAAISDGESIRAATFELCLAELFEQIIIEIYE